MDHSKTSRHQQNYVKNKVRRWDMFAKFVPASLLLLNAFLITFNYVDFHNAFWITLILASAISCIWWIWTITTIRLVKNTLAHAENSLLDVSNDLKEIVKDVKDFQQK